MVSNADSVVAPEAQHGVLVVDKPAGMTSHDVVRIVRRALHTRRVGHAGTLDPMATGVLVVGIGEGTKLLHHLTADDKTYVATLSLGSETDTLDADGTVVVSEPVPESLTAERVREAMLAFVGKGVQVAPKVSAIKQQGVPLYERVRRGEDVVAPTREVMVHELELLVVRPTEIDLRVRCGKGFYVRSLGRDLAIALGTRGHLSALRRTSSGAFDLADAVPVPADAQAQLDGDTASRLRAGVLRPAAALRGVPRVRVGEAGLEDVRQGRGLAPDKLLGTELPGEGTSPIGIETENGELVGLGRSRGGRIEIVRGILA